MVRDVDRYYYVREGLADQHERYNVADSDVWRDQVEELYRERQEAKSRGG